MALSHPTPLLGTEEERERTKKMGDVLEFGTDPHKLVRRDGMDTSRDAANEVCTTKLEAEVYMVIKAAGRAGMISDEVRKAMPHVTSYSSVTARYKSLKEKGLIVATDGRRKGSSGRNQAVMVACCHIPVPF